MARLEPFVPKSHGRPRADDRRVSGVIIFISRNGLRWRDAPAEYGPAKNLYNRSEWWGDMGVFARMMLGLAQARADPSTLMIDATYLKALPTASSLQLKTGVSNRLIGRMKGGLNTKLHALTDRDGKPLRVFLSAGQLSDYTGGLAMYSSFPEVDFLSADRGYAADWFRYALKSKGITPCIPRTACQI